MEPYLFQPSGLLLYLDSEEDVPEDDVDRINTRDNLKLAMEHENRKKRNIQWKMIEKQVDQLLQHWRARIGLESRAVGWNIRSDFVATTRNLKC